jgi:hypothetical protein
MSVAGRRVDALLAVLAVSAMRRIVRVSAGPPCVPFSSLFVLTSHVEHVEAVLGLWKKVKACFLLAWSQLKPFSTNYPTYHFPLQTSSVPLSPSIGAHTAP